MTDEAIEAAARGLARHKWPTAIGVWDSFGQGMQDDFRDQARAALEAGAPHMDSDLVARIRAVLRLISPDEITPMGVRMVEKVLDEYDPPAE